MEKTHLLVSQSPASVTTPADKKTPRPEVPFNLYAFPFENVVFEGGSGNLLAYVGAVRVSYRLLAKFNFANSQNKSPLHIHHVSENKSATQSSIT